METKKNKITFECKRHKGFSWNELVKYYEKLVSRTSREYNSFLVFKANQQPVLVMHQETIGLAVNLFEDFFGVPFEKHKTKKVKNETRTVKR